MASFSLRFATVFALCLILSACVGGSERHQKTPANSALPSSSHSLTDPSDATCVTVGPYPELPVYELNSRLPIKDVDLSYVQSELLLYRGSGQCESRSVMPTSPECEAVVGSSETWAETILWRNGDALVTELFAAGAVSFLTEGMTGRTKQGKIFRYRMTAVMYDSADAAAKSPVFDIVEKCDRVTRETHLGFERLVLRSGSEPSLIAYQDENRVLLIESVIVESASDRIPDTPSGLLPMNAINAVDEWWRAQVRALR